MFNQYLINILGVTSNLKQFHDAYYNITECLTFNVFEFMTPVGEKSHCL